MVTVKVNWKRPGLIALFGAVASAFFAGLSFYFAYVFRFAVSLESPPLTTDQILSALTLVVTLAGLLMAVVAIGVGAAAVFGFGELRNMVSRRADETLLTVVSKLRKRGDISAIEASELFQLLDNQDDRIESVAEAAASKAMTSAELYPEKGVDDGNVGDLPKP
ncbi:MAG TPA: hypothetical protein VHX37_14110 [Acidobacteriaceae bacterium]|jgi:hypothetical protein|nr:hypothetical protein [Acidobacteriaceae bacterium]